MGYIYVEIRDLFRMLMIIKKFLWANLNFIIALVLDRCFLLFIVSVHEYRGHIYTEERTYLPNLLAKQKIKIILEVSK